MKQERDGGLGRCGARCASGESGSPDMSSPTESLWGRRQGEEKNMKVSHKAGQV